MEIKVRTQCLHPTVYVLLMAFYNTQGIFLYEFLDCCITVWPLKEAIQMKYHGMLAQKVILLQGSTRPNIAGVATTQLLGQLLWKHLDHLLYNPDLAVSHFHFTGWWVQTLSLGFISKGVNHVAKVSHHSGNFMKKEFVHYSLFFWISM
jgi:hypothetical protein